ncbi:MAG: hypothetical protein ACOY35_11880 [Bacillota bacterium]
MDVFFRKITTKKNGKEYVYVKLIENYRQDGKVKQRVIANFGSVDNLSTDRINYLIASLRKLHNEIDTQAIEPKIPHNVASQAGELKRMLNNSQLKGAMVQLLGERACEVAEALIIKSITAGEVNKPVQEVCKNMGLVDATSLQFYNVLKSLGQDEAKEVLFKTRIGSAGGNDIIHKPGFVHIFKSTFEGSSFDVDMTGSVYMPQGYQKEILLLLACDNSGAPIDFEYIEESQEIPRQLSLLVKRLTKQFSENLIILDEEKLLNNHEIFPTAKPVSPVPEEIMAELTNGSMQKDNNLFFQVFRYKQVSEGKIKEIRAKLAKVSAGLETIKADVLLGKLTKESNVRKKADSVIKSNQCENLVSYSFNEDDQSFSYRINEESLNQSKQSKLVTIWVVPNEATQEFKLEDGLEVKTDRFHVITDQLKIPPINLYVDYHYSPEIISGHIQLEIIKNQILNTMNTPYQGGEI